MGCRNRRTYLKKFEADQWLYNELTLSKSLTPWDRSHIQVGAGTMKTSVVYIGPVLLIGQRDIF